MTKVHACVTFADSISICITSLYFISVYGLYCKIDVYVKNFAMNM